MKSDSKKNREDEHVDFDRFVKAVQEFGLEPKRVKATAHQSAVSVNWEEVAGMLREDQATKEEE